MLCQNITNAAGMQCRRQAAGCKGHCCTTVPRTRLQAALCIQLHGIACRTDVLLAMAHPPCSCQSCLISRHSGSMLQGPIMATTAPSSPVSLPPVLLGQQVLHVGKHEAAKEAIAVPPCPANLAVLPFKCRNLGQEDMAALLILCRQGPRTCAGLVPLRAPWCCGLVAQHTVTLSMPSDSAGNSPDGG